MSGKKKKESLIPTYIHLLALIAVPIGWGIGVASPKIESDQGLFLSAIAFGASVYVAYLAFALLAVLPDIIDLMICKLTGK